MIKIALTGGPCAGKTTLTARITKELPEKGYHVFIVSEAASNIIVSGIKPGNEVSMESFQDFIMDYQIFQEEQFDKIDKFYPSDKVVVIYDRGLCDQIAYIGKPHFKDMLKARGLTFAQARDRYDAVLFLQSAANGAEEFYTMVNMFNGEEVQIRYETVDEARALNDRTLNAWVGHPHLRVIGNEGNFEEKMDRAMQEIWNILGVPVVTETERKFLIRRPSQEQLDTLDMCSKSDIINTYLKETKEGVERRVRQRGINGDYSFYYTEKKDVPGSSMARHETERKIKQKDYLRYLTEADTSLRQVVKHRYCHVYKNQYFEIDIYDFDGEYAILELELSKEGQEINIPDYIEIIKEVTDDKRYRNRILATNLSFPSDKAIR